MYAFERKLSEKLISEHFKKKLMKILKFNFFKETKIFSGFLSNLMEEKGGMRVRRHKYLELNP